MEKKQATYLTLGTLAAEAKRIPDMRIGQYVCNVLYPESGEDTAELFYCRDDKFWAIVSKFVEIV